MAARDPARLDDAALEIERYADEASRGVRIPQAEFGALQALVGGEGILVVERARPLDPAFEIADRHRIGSRRRRRRKKGQQARGQEPRTSSREGPPPARSLGSRLHPADLVSTRPSFLTTGIEAVSARGIGPRCGLRTMRPARTKAQWVPRRRVASFRSNNRRDGRRMTALSRFGGTVMSRRLAFAGGLAAALVMSAARFRPRGRATATGQHGRPSRPRRAVEGREPLPRQRVGREDRLLAYNQNCARCHGLQVISGGIAPDLRYLEKGKEGDEWFKERVTHGAIVDGNDQDAGFRGRDLAGGPLGYPQLHRIPARR